MNVYENGPWRNRSHQPYEQYCYEDELPQNLAKLFKLYGAAFDDDWQYRRVKHPKPQRQIISRRPHWMDKTTGGWYLDKGLSRKLAPQREIQQKLVIIGKKEPI